jgi:RNA polymerase sigma factor (TIGR02999 family)
MSDMTLLLDAAASGDVHAAATILPLVYDELRRLAAARLANEPNDHTLQPTALVHEAYLRLVGPTGGSEWENRAHFFGAAAQAMRRVLVDHARTRQAEKRGGLRRRVELDATQLPVFESDPDRWMALDEALTAFALDDPTAARVAELRLCVGLSIQEAGDALGLSRSTAFRHWTYARAWLTARLSESDS